MKPSAGPFPRGSVGRNILSGERTGERRGFGRLSPETPGRGLRKRGTRNGEWERSSIENRISNYERWAGERGDSDGMRRGARVAKPAPSHGLRVGRIHHRRQGRLRHGAACPTGVAPAFAPARLGIAGSEPEVRARNTELRTETAAQAAGSARRAACVRRGGSPARGCCWLTALPPPRRFAAASAPNGCAVQPSGAAATTRRLSRDRRRGRGWGRGGGPRRAVAWRASFLPGRGGPGPRGRARW